MKVLLVDPPDLFLDGGGVTRQVLPLGLAYVGAVARAAGHDVRLLLPDTRACVDRDPWGEVERAIAAEAPDVVGVPVVTPLVESAAEVARRVRRAAPGATLVLGGPHVTAGAIEALREIPDADVAVQGEGEGPFSALLASLASGSGRGAWSAIPGLAWREPGGGLSVRPPDPGAWPALDDLPLPQRDGLVWPADVQPGLYQSLITQRGCAFACAYCSVPGASGRRVRGRSIPAVVAEVRELRERFDATFLWIHDSVFPRDAERTVALCDALVDGGVATPFSCQARPEPLAPRVVGALRRAGCVQVLLGLESGHPETLARIHKPRSAASAREAVHRLHDQGVRAAGFFMLGFPWETEAHLAATIDVALGLDLDALHLFAATPLPGTELAALTGPVRLPPRHDFRTPAVNLTALPDARFRELFEAAKGRFAAYNQGRTRVDVRST
jgi:radical SAM superfamily enzyme YgiQ (UPF0313 family)